MSSGLGAVPMPIEQSTDGTSLTAPGVLPTLPPQAWLCSMTKPAAGGCPQNPAKPWNLSTWRDLSFVSALCGLSWSLSCTAQTLQSLCIRGYQGRVSSTLVLARCTTYTPQIFLLLSPSLLTQALINQAMLMTIKTN